MIERITIDIKSFRKIILFKNRAPINNVTKETYEISDNALIDLDSIAKNP